MCETPYYSLDYHLYWRKKNKISRPNFKEKRRITTWTILKWSSYGNACNKLLTHLSGLDFEMDPKQWELSHSEVELKKKKKKEEGLLTRAREMDRGTGWPIIYSLLTWNYFDILWFSEKFYTKEKRKILGFEFALSIRMRDSNLRSLETLRRYVAQVFKCYIGNTLVIKWVY